MAIQEWNARSTHCLDHVKKLYGKSLHTASLIPAGCAYLTGLERMVAVWGKKNPSSHTDRINSLRKTSPGGSTLSSRELQPAPSILLPPSSTSPPFLMLALASALASSSAPNGEPGGSSQDGKNETASETSHGPKPLPSNSSSFPSLAPLILNSTSSSTATTPALSKAGKLADTATMASTPSSNESTPFWPVNPAPSLASLFDLSQASTTQQMPPPEPSMASPTSSSLVYLPQHLSELVINFSEPLHPRELHARASDSYPTAASKFIDRLQREQEAAARTPAHQYNDDEASVIPSTTHKTPAARFNGPFTPTVSSAAPPKPGPYKPDLTPNPSSLRPHCLAWQHLILWRPAHDSLRSPSKLDSTAPNLLSDDELDRIPRVISASWAESTKELYGTGLLTFHVYCDVSFQTVTAHPYHQTSSPPFKAWHILHGLEWNIRELKYKALLEGANRLAPSSSKPPKRAPFTVQILEKFRQSMNTDDPRDAAIFACITCSFYCIARLGEFTVPAISKYDHTKHMSRAGISFTHNHDNLPVITFSFPCTKTSSNGEQA